MTAEANGKPAPPAPGTVNIGQVLHDGHMWVGIEAIGSVMLLQVAQGQAKVTVTFDPKDVAELGRKLVELSEAGQVALSAKRVLRPGE